MSAHKRTPQSNAKTGSTVLLVRPRWVWGGLAVVLVGSGMLGLAVVDLSVPTGVVGAVVFAVGAAVAVRAGGLHDVHSANPGQELAQVVEGDVHRGVASGDTIASEPARATAIELTALTQRLHHERRRAPRPPLAPLGAGLVLAITTFLLVAQWEIYPLGHTSQHNARRTLLIAVLATLAALRILVGQPARHRVACLLLVLCGAALVVQGCLIAHEITATAGIEGAAGVLVLVAALVCVVSPQTSSSRRPAQCE